MALPAVPTVYPTSLTGRPNVTLSNVCTAPAVYKAPFLTLLARPKLIMFFDARYFAVAYVPPTKPSPESPQP